MGENDKFTNAKGEEVKRQPCQIFVRIMGYLRPISQANIWKKSEAYSRKYFDESVSMATIARMEEDERIESMRANNRNFVAQYS
jgi:hypothetical protein